jgi:hypothetical protein
MRSFLVIAILVFTGAAQAGSLAVPTVRISPSIHVPSHPVAVSQSTGAGAGKTQFTGSGGGAGKITSMRKAGGDPTVQGGSNGQPTTGTGGRFMNTISIKGRKQGVFRKGQ